MGAAENKELIRQLGKAKGIEGMFALMADDVRWTLIGTTKFSGSFNGKQEILDKLVHPIVSEMESMGSSVIDAVIADDDYVVVQMRGTDRKTKTGRPYNNTYCVVYRLAGGKIKEITEYCDTELVTQAFGK
jgi:ketosteroid isomerase-like protein